VVCNGTATRAQVEGLSIAGKTGTAFKAADNGTYFDENGDRIYYASFVGFFPADDPQVTGLVSVDGDREPYALELLSTLLDGGDSTRLTRDVVRGSRVANRAGAGYSMTQRGPALFTLNGTPAEGRTTEDVERALRAAIGRIATEGVPQAELERAKVQYVAGQVYQRDSVFSQAMEIAGLEIVGLSHRDADRILEKIRSVTADEVRAVAGKYFGDDALTVATLLPQPIGERRRGAAPAGMRH